MYKVTKKLEPSTNKSIIREKVWIDTKIVSTTYKHLINKVTHCAFNSDLDPSVVPEGFAKANAGKMHTYVCFSGLIGQIKDAKGNRVYSKLEVAKPTKSDPASNVVLTPEERSGWLSLAKKYKLLPPYINEDAIEDIPKEKQRSAGSSGHVEYSTTIASGEFIIDLEGLSPAMLYIYLSTIRNIREDPGFPRAVLYLVNKIGMNFFAAYVFASMVTLNSIGHHIIDAFRPYGMCKEVYDKDSKTYTSHALDLKAIEGSVHTSINKAIGLQRMVNNDPLKYDSRSLPSAGYGFDCTNTINRISKVSYLASFQELFDEDIIAAIMSKDDKKGNECLKRFIEKKPRIKYKEAEK